MPCRCTASRCFSPRPDLIDKYPTHDDQKARWRMPVLFKTVQQANKDAVKQYPLIMTSGRLVEYEGGGDETRSNPWLAELQQEMFVEINPKDANDRGVQQRRIRVGRNADQGAPQGQDAGDRARRRRAPCSCRSTSPAGGMGKDLLDYYPEGAAPIVRGEAVNTATTYGYDIVTMMQETKTTLCQIAKRHKSATRAEESHHGKNEISV